MLYLPIGLCSILFLQMHFYSMYKMFIKMAKYIHKRRGEEKNNYYSWLCSSLWSCASADLVETFLNLFYLKLGKTFIRIHQGIQKVLADSWRRKRSYCSQYLAQTPVSPCLTICRLFSLTPYCYSWKYFPVMPNRLNNNHW